MEDKEKLREQILWTLCRYRDGGKKSVEVAASEIMQLIANPIPDMSKEWQVIEYKHIPTSEALGKPVIISNVNSKYWEKAKTDPEYSINAVKVGNEIYRCGDKVKWNWVYSPHQYETISAFERNDKGDIGIYTEELAKNKALYVVTDKYWKFTHYHAPEPVQEEKVDMEIDGIKYIMSKRMAGLVRRAIDSSIINEGPRKSAPVEKEPEVILRTIDGKSITDPDTIIWGVTDQWQRLSWTARDVQAGMGAAYKWLSTKDKMDEYITRWKPQLSLEEVNQAIVSTTGIVPMYARERLYEIVKKVAEQKIKQQ